MTNELPTEQLATFIRTLVASGFVIDEVLRKPAYVVARCARLDEFGLRVPYVAVLATELGVGDATAILRLARLRQALPFVVAESAPDEVAHLSWAAFLGRLGGPVASWLPLDSSYCDALETISRNERLDGSDADPSDLFETYVHAGLQFLVAGRVVKYGQARLFEVLPDGIGIPAATPPWVFLYDAKAYREGYPIDRDSVRQFSDYVRRFHERYSAHVGRVHSFLVISSAFRGGEAAIVQRSDELYEDCQVRLSTMTAGALCEITRLLLEDPGMRNVVPWRSVLSHASVTADTVRRAVETARRDDLVR